jgi:hypothetical protein
VTDIVDRYDQLVFEHYEMDVRLMRLKKAIKRQVDKDYGMKKISDHHLELMKAQAAAMEQYVAVLGDRIIDMEGVILG